MKKMMYIVFCILISTNAFANIAIQAQAPDLAGDFIGEVKFLKILHEKLILDCTGGQSSSSSAEYIILNTSNSLVETELMFVTPFMKSVSVKINQVETEIIYSGIEIDALPYIKTSDMKEYNFNKKIGAYKFIARFEPQQETVILIQFRLPAGYDNRIMQETGRHAAFSHLFNWGKEPSRQSWFVYYLAAAETFTGGIDVLDVEILSPQDALLSANIPLAEGKTEKGIKHYTQTFKGIPAPFIDVKVLTQSSGYNFMGATAGLGVATNYSNFTSFSVQALFDIYFDMHQISVGIEGNPFGNNMRIPLLYSFIMATGNSLNYGMFGDLRFSAGGLFEMFPEYQTGFRIAAGVRILVSIIEITYDFYPLDAAAGYQWRMTFLYKISL